jgi:hypothetical protein
MLAADTGTIAFPILTALILTPMIGRVARRALPKSVPEIPKMIALCRRSHRWRCRSG